MTTYKQEIQALKSTTASIADMLGDLINYDCNEFSGPAGKAKAHLTEAKRLLELKISYMESNVDSHRTYVEFDENTWKEVVEGASIRGISIKEYIRDIVAGMVG